MVERDPRQRFGHSRKKREAKRPHEYINPSLREVWRSGPESKISYSLLQVPLDVPFSLSYTKPSHELDFVMSPTKNPQAWELKGDIDSDIMQLMGMSITKPRRGKAPPVVTEKDFEALRKFGEVDTTDDEIYEVSLIVPLPNIETLVYELWNPKKFRKIDTPLFSLKDNGQGNRMLPQKIYPNPSDPILRIIF